MLCHKLSYGEIATEIAKGNTEDRLLEVYATDENWSMFTRKDNRRLIQDFFKVTRAATEWEHRIAGIYEDSKWLAGEINSSKNCVKIHKNRLNLMIAALKKVGWKPIIENVNQCCEAV